MEIAYRTDDFERNGIFRSEGNAVCSVRPALAHVSWMSRRQPDAGVHRKVNQNQICWVLQYGSLRTALTERKKFFQVFLISTPTTSVHQKMRAFQDFTKKWDLSSHRRIVASSHRRIVAVPCFSDRIPESIGFGFWFFWAFLFVWTARQLLRVSIRTIYYPGSSSTRSSSRSTNLVVHRFTGHRSPVTGHRSVWVERIMLA